MQWTTDVTEHAHVEVVKEPFHASNYCDFDSQICCAMDCAEWHYNFDLATFIKLVGIDVFSSRHVSEDPNHNPNSDELNDNDTL